MIMQEFDSPELILLELYLDHSRLRKSQGDLQVDRLLFCHIFVQRADPQNRESSNLVPRSLRSLFLSRALKKRDCEQSSKQASSVTLSQLLTLSVVSPTSHSCPTPRHQQSQPNCRLVPPVATLYSRCRDPEHLGQLLPAKSLECFMDKPSAPVTIYQRAVVTPLTDAVRAEDISCSTS